MVLYDKRVRRDKKGREGEEGDGCKRQVKMRVESLLIWEEHQEKEQ